MDSSDANGLLCVARAFIDTRTHKILGIIRADVNLSQFTNDIAHISMNNTGKLFLVYENHIINTWNDSYINNFVNENEFFKAISADSDKPQLVQINKEKHIINHSRLKDSSLILVRASKLDDFNSDIHIIEKSMITTGIIALLVALIFIFIFTCWLTAPITKLIKHMERFENNYERIPIEIPSHDEMGKLGESYNSMLNTIDSLITDVEDLYKKQKIFELKALQAQINPHFLYNTLDSIIWMIQSGEYKGAEQMVSLLAKFFRISLSQGQDIISLKKELEHATSYLSIQNIRFKDKFDFSVQADENLLQYLCPKLSIQPLLENAIYHGMEGIYDDGEIQISIYEKNSLIHIDVIDNGLGMPPETIEYIMHNKVVSSKRGSGIGVRNVDERIKLIFGNAYGVVITSELDEGTTASIIIPKIKKVEDIGY
jgi:two-component system sensor histidine kinase YesM